MMIGRLLFCVGGKRMRYSVSTPIKSVVRPRVLSEPYSSRSRAKTFLLSKAKSVSYTSKSPLYLNQNFNTAHKPPQNLANKSQSPIQSSPCSLDQLIIADREDELPPSTAVRSHSKSAGDQVTGGETLLPVEQSDQLLSDPVSQESVSASKWQREESDSVSDRQREELTQFSSESSDERTEYPGEYALSIILIPFMPP